MPLEIFNSTLSPTSSSKSSEMGTRGHRYRQLHVEIFSQVCPPPGIIVRSCMDRSQAILLGSALMEPPPRGCRQIPAPFALHPTSYTLHSDPQPPHPTPCTLHPNPELPTPNPEPQIPNPCRAGGRQTPAPRATHSSDRGDLHRARHRARSRVPGLLDVGSARRGRLLGSPHPR